MENENENALEFENNTFKYNYVQMKESLVQYGALTIKIC